MTTEIQFILIISYRGIFRRRCVCLPFARRPRKQCSRVSHEMAQFALLKMAHLAIFDGTNPVTVSSPDYGSWHYAKMGILSRVKNRPFQLGMYVLCCRPSDVTSRTVSFNCKKAKKQIPLEDNYVVWIWKINPTSWKGLLHRLWGQELQTPSSLIFQQSLRKANIFAKEKN